MAQMENKLVFIHLENNRCEQCNEVASIGFGSDLLKDKFEKNFISVRTKIESIEGQTLAEIFRIRSTPISLYVDNDGNILSSFNGSTSNAGEYLKLADLALERKDKKKLSDYEKEYRAGEKSISFLKAFIISRAESGKSSEDLLELYIKELPQDSLKDLKNLEFVYAQGPALDSPVYKTLQSVSKNSSIDSLYSSLPSEKAQQISDAIVSNSFRKSVFRKDEKLAWQTAGFSMKIFKDDPFSANLAYHRNIIRYFRNTSNRNRYVQETERFLDSLHMNMTIDSLNTFDEHAFNKLLAQQKPGKSSKPVSITLAFSAPSQFIIKDLNDNAFHFYEVITNKNDLENALKWSNKSIELLDASREQTLKKMKGAKNFPPMHNSNILDTNARLLYKLGKKQQAIEMQGKAIESHKLTGMPTNSFEKVLTQMINGTL
ncbi:hypothetical protein Dfri01_15100 [Dyadobacter frigoris]|nr:hypothetical protein Dfri01_15100 [Dyadobacter frigoris]